MGKSEGKKPLERTSCRLVYSIKIDLRERRTGDMEWIDLAQDRDQSRALVNLVRNRRIP
jgi:hypothetical protein